MMETLIGFVSQAADVHVSLECIDRDLHDRHAGDPQRGEAADRQGIRLHRGPGVVCGESRQVGEH